MGIFTKASSSPSTRTEPDRRRYPRFNTSERTQVFGTDGGGVLSSGVIRDICGGGACLAVETEMSVGLRVQFQCSIGAIAAVVKHCSPFPQGYLIGVEFTVPVSLDPDPDRTLPAAW